MSLRSARHLVIVLLFATLASGSGALAAAVPDDRAALAGVSSGKGFFDVNVAEADRLLLYLKVIGLTHASLAEQQVSPDLIVAFRGPAVKLLVLGDEKGQAIAGQIRRLHEQGVRFEACAVATGLFEVDVTKLPAEVTLVGNTFVSSIGYQSRGYALIPIL